MKAAEQIFARDQIYSGLAADRGVHLGQQRGGNLNHRNTAHEDRRQESGDVADDAAAERDDHARPVAAGCDHLFGQSFHFGQSLFGLAARERREPCARDRLCAWWRALPWSFNTSAVVTTNTMPARGGRNSATRANEPRSTMAS